MKLFFYFLFLLFALAFIQKGYAQSYSGYELMAIEFEGNETFSAAELALQIESKETPWWLFKFLNELPFGLGAEKVYFDSSNLSIDKEALKAFYQANGFFETKVSHKIEADSADLDLTLIYIIEENDPAMYGNVRLHGFSEEPEWIFEDVKSLINVDSSKRYVQFEIENDIAAIVNYLTNRGYYFAEYDSTIIIMDTLTNFTNIDLHFTPEDQYNIKEIRVEKDGVGKDLVSNDLMLEISHIQPGQIYDNGQVTRAELRLLRTGMFNSVDISGIPEDTVNHKIPLKLSANIGYMHELAPEILANNQLNSFNIGVGVNYIKKNFLGEARKLTLSTSLLMIDFTNFNFGDILSLSEPSDSSFQGEFEAIAKLEQPFTFGKPIYTTIEGYYRVFALSTYAGRNYGTNLKLDIEMPQHTFLTLLRPTVEYDVLEFNFGLLDNGVDVDAISTTPSLGVELASSKPDDLLFPTQGYTLNFFPEIAYSRSTLTLSGPAINQTLFVPEITQNENAYFYRLQAGGTVYFPLDRRNMSVFGIKLQTGYVQTISGPENVIPPTKTLYAGGSNSVRGWRARELVPQDTVDYFGITTNQTPRGGTLLLEGSFEVRNKFNQFIGMAFFLDYGNTWNGLTDFDISETAVALGIGFRYYSPIAPFRLDIGWQFYDPFTQEIMGFGDILDKWTIHFGIGEAF